VARSVHWLGTLSLAIWVVMFALAAFAWFALPHWWPPLPHHPPRQPPGGCVFFNVALLNLVLDGRLGAIVECRGTVADEVFGAILTYAVVWASSLVALMGMVLKLRVPSLGILFAFMPPVVALSLVSYSLRRWCAQRGLTAAAKKPMDGWEKAGLAVAAILLAIDMTYCGPVTLRAISSWEAQQCLKLPWPTSRFSFCSSST
jgi:hypothetical protein